MDRSLISRTSRLLVFSFLAVLACAAPAAADLVTWQLRGLTFGSFEAGWGGSYSTQELIWSNSGGSFTIDTNTNTVTSWNLFVGMFFTLPDPLEYDSFSATFDSIYGQITYFPSPGVPYSFYDLSSNSVSFALSEYHLSTGPSIAGLTLTFPAGSLDDGAKLVEIGGDYNFMGPYVIWSPVPIVGGTAIISSGYIVVPLPPTLILLGSVLLGLVGLRRFRKD